jgi:hypothetical protein
MGEKPIYLRGVFPILFSIEKKKEKNRMAATSLFQSRGSCIVLCEFLIECL